MILLLCLGLLQDTTLSDTLDIVRYRANSIIYDLEKSVIILKDSAIITYKDIKLTSDSARYYVETKHLEAFGECDLRQLSDSIKGDFLRYNIENKKALMNLGKTQIDKGFLEGQDIYWIDEKTVNCYRGKYTTCNDSPPHYYFYSPTMKVYLGDVVIARPLYLYIQGIPVLAAPFWFVPISSKRKSGLLPFRIGNSSTFGKYIRDFAYFLVLSDYADVTIQVDALEKKGIMPQIEGIWDYRPYAKGKIFGSYIRDTELEKTRYSIEARNSSEAFLLGSSLNFDIKYVSDNSYRQDYAETTAIWLEKEITSSATLTRTFGGYKNNFSFERRQDFTDTTISLKLPIYTLNGPSSMLFRTINYSLSGHVSRDRYTTPRDTTEAIGANLHTTPTIQQNIFNLLSLSPKLNLDLALFEEDTAGNQWPTRFGYSFTTSASTNLFRVFNTNLLGIHGVLHKVMPSITYTYTPAFDFARFPTVTGIPTYLYTNGISIALNQELEAKIGDDLKKVSLLRFNLNGSYAFLNDSLSPISFLIAAPYNPFPAWVSAFSTQVDGSIDPYTRDYDYSITNTSGIKFDFFSITVGQGYQRQGIYQIWFNGDVKPTANWSLTYSARYDWQTKKLVDYSFGLVRNLHCWEAILNFNQLGDEWRYDFKIRIKAIPEVSIGKGLLGYIFE
jgi:lipopolysaccharide assembly outer membrane protein LptD (OstA)